MNLTSPTPNGGIGLAALVVVVMAGWIGAAAGDAKELRDPKHMYAPVALPGAPEDYDWTKLKRVPHEHGVIFAGEPPTHGFNMHGYLAFFDGRYWETWSCGAEFEDVSGQHVRYATSRDGLKWEPAGIAIPADPSGEMRYFARGFWVRDGELLLLAARDEAWSVVDGVRKKGRLFGPGLQLVAYRFNGETGAWDYLGVTLDDTITNYPPKRMPTGDWMLTRRDHQQNISVAVGGVAGFDKWDLFPMPEAEDGQGLDEPHVWALPNGTVAAQFRPSKESYEIYGNYRLYRAFSDDGGRTWCRPVRTDFPDARAKSNGFCLSNGRYVLVGNTRSGIDPRIPLTIATSDDGVVFGDLWILRDEDTQARHPNFSKRAGYQYPHVTEINGFVFILYSKNQEDIEVLKIPLSALK